MRLLRGVHWYLRELTGEAQYDHYLARHATTHAGAAPLTRREFEKQRVDRADARPGSRCC
jgi:uncharacterized short protein YbdD (DUF466 family)